MSGNPNPQHNPTDGLGVAAYIQLAGTNLTNRANGGLTVATEGTANDTTGLNGQGFGAVAGSNTSFKPNAQYHLILSLGANTIGGTAYAATCQLTASAVDVEGAAYSPVGSFVYFSYSDPANKAGSPPVWYKPSDFGSYDPNVASVSSSGLITARALGQAIIEVSFPFSDNTLGNDAQGEKEPDNFIYSQIVVDVVA